VGILALQLPLNPVQAQPQPAKPILISGSSTVFPFSKAAIASFTKGRGAGISAEATGTSAGLRQFCAGRIVLAAASRPINAKELKACDEKGVTFLELPLAFDAITVVVNSANGFARQISTEQLKQLWSMEAQGKVTRWRQVNPNWPDQTIKLCGPGKDSGTYDTFNKAINGSESNSRQDYTSSEDDTVLVRCVATTPGALGYFGFDYYQANRSRLRALAVQGPRGPVLPSLKSVQSSQYLPLSRPLFYYVNAAEVQTNPLLRNFIDHTLQRGGRIASQAGLIPLQDSTYRLVTNKLYRNVQGSAFEGALPIGLSVGQILQRSFDAQKQPQFR
jgi:phosphate transport system substrate-binding protein